MFFHVLDIGNMRKSRKEQVEQRIRPDPVLKLEMVIFQKSGLESEMFIFGLQHLTSTSSHTPHVLRGQN